MPKQFVVNHFNFCPSKLTIQVIPEFWRMFDRPMKRTLSKVQLCCWITLHFLTQETPALAPSLCQCSVLIQINHYVWDNVGLKEPYSKLTIKDLSPDFRLDNNFRSSPTKAVVESERQICFQSALTNQHSIVIHTLFKGLIQEPNHASHTPEQPRLGEQRGQKEEIEQQRSKKR